MSDDTGDAIAIAIVAAGAWAGGWWIGGGILTAVLLIDISDRASKRKRGKEPDQ